MKHLVTGGAGFVGARLARAASMNWIDVLFNNAVISGGDAPTWEPHPGTR